MTSYALLSADDDTVPFWEAASERRLVIPRCDSCGRWVWLPAPVCPTCASTALTWTDAPGSGTGTVVSWIVAHPPVVPIFQAHVPFAVLLVEIAPGVRLLGQLVDDDGSILTTDGHDTGLALGLPVSLRWCDLDGQLIPTWTSPDQSRSDQPGATPA